ncbi:hypothetical protein E8E14_006034 [Neopestalotiopsis sp. 37M]|nr:hypothetical protein E8E14_006034 [Neopestalotiopsis sp. 37M]
MSVQDYENLGILPGKQRKNAQSNINGTVLEIKDITVHESEKSDRPRVFPTPKDFQHNPDEDDPYRSIALLIRRKFRLASDGKPLLKIVELVIRNKLLCQALETVLVDYPFFHSNGNEIVLKSPYRELFYYRQELQDLSGSHQDDGEMDLLLKFISDRMGKQIDEYTQLIAKRQITWKLLWTIYRPGSLVYTLNDGNPRCFVVADFENGILRCYSWGYKGGQFGTVKYEIQEDTYRGARNIVDLQAIPLEWLPKQESIRDSLIRRGHKWSRLIKFCHMQYNGVAMRLKPAVEKPSMGMFRQNNEKQYDRYKQRVSGRIVLDCDKLEEKHSGAIPNLDQDILWTLTANIKGTKNDFMNIPYYKDYKISEEQALICPPHVFGYVLQDKFWAEFNVDSVEDIAWDETSFDKLQIDLEVKMTLQSLIDTHESSRHKFRDVVFQKGLGRIFLFHGPPGCGKTLTAETISEHVKKPLYYATTGQLGIDLATTEENLTAIFDLAQSWNAVLLIDEADVFLAARNSENIERNAFVSIFLRSLEYYQGIMILTTNRLEDFDIAFRSRIHVDFEYKIPDQRCRTAIWRDLFNANAAETSATDDEVSDLGRDFELNGRDIKNLFSTALAIASEEGADDGIAKKIRM